jgi:hypothetical protein
MTRTAKHALWLAAAVAVSWHTPAWAQVGGTTGGGGARGGTGTTTTSSGGVTGSGGISGSMGGSGFSGGSISGGTGTTGGTGFTGGGGFSGSTGGTGITGGGITGTTGSGVPSPSNYFLPNYTNPMFAGFPVTSTSGSSTSAFTDRKGGYGQPLFSTTNIRGTVVGSGVGTVGTTSQMLVGSSFTTIGMRRNIPYVTVLGEELPRPAYVLNRLDLQGVLDRAPLKSRPNISVQVAGNTVTLRGDVTSAREKRLAENMIRLTPGVRDVNNELRITSVSASK